MNTKIALYCAAFLIVAFVSLSSADDFDCSKHPAPLDPRSCCSVPDFVTDDIKEKCQQYDEPLPRPGDNNDNDDDDDNNDDDVTDRPRPRPHPRPHPHPHPHPRPPHHPCFMSCLLNETGILVDDVLNESNLEKYLGEALNEVPSMIPVLQTAFTTCSTKRDEMRAQWQEHIKSHPQHEKFARRMHRRCTPTGAMLLGCVFVEAFNNCAEDVWQDTQQCNDWRTFMMNCKPPRGPWGKHGKPMNVDTMANDEK